VSHLRDEYLAEADGDDECAAVNFAHDLTKGDPATFKAGYTPRNAALASAELFLVDVDVIEAAVEYRIARLQADPST
jgi:hypothetical protein